MFDALAARDELVAVAILVLGVIAARLLSVAVGAILDFLDRRTARLTTSEKSVISPRLVRIARTIVFWMVIILAISYALRVLGIGGIATMLNAVITFVPQLLVGLMIVVAGHVVGLIVSHVVANLSEDMTASSLAPRMLYGAILIVAVVMGLQHIDVDISFVTQLMLIVIAVAGGGLMLAFALGSRQHVANLLARRELSRLAVGDRIRVDAVEGEVVDIHATGIDIANDEGIVRVPAARLAETSVLHKPAAE
ncbi:MAG: mechanosensitive ion channel [Gammaproteobacteria bacterium]|nr:mechanosensitive ion channel [Gammaproteobacteria bacterium]